MVDSKGPKLMTVIKSRIPVQRSLVFLFPGSCILDTEG